jgi:hypothetical protein
MLELEHNGFYPLTRDHLELYVPSRPGIFTLAVRLVSGEHKAFFTSQSDNLYRSLGALTENNWLRVPELARDYLRQYQCYFTYFVILQQEYRDEVEKMLIHTSDPVHTLKVINCN